MTTDHQGPTLADLLRQQKQARRELAQLRRLFPGAFNTDGSPRVAVLRMPGKESKHG